MRTNPTAGGRGPGEAGPLATFDLAHSLEELKRGDRWRQGDRAALTFLHTPALHVTLIAIRSGTRVREHRTGHPLTLQVLEGRLRFHAGQQSVTVAKGEFVTLAADVPHEIEGLEESSFLLTLPADAAHSAGD